MIAMCFLKYLYEYMCVCGCVCVCVCVFCILAPVFFTEVDPFHILKKSHKKVKFTFSQFIMLSL